MQLDSQRDGQGNKQADIYRINNKTWRQEDRILQEEKRTGCELDRQMKGETDTQIGRGLEREECSEMETGQAMSQTDRERDKETGQTEMVKETYRQRIRQAVTLTGRDSQNFIRKRR